MASPMATPFVAPRGWCKSILTYSCLFVGLMCVSSPVVCQVFCTLCTCSRQASLLLDIQYVFCLLETQLVSGTLGMSQG